MQEPGYVPIGFGQAPGSGDVRHLCLMGKHLGTGGLLQSSQRACMIDMAVSEYDPLHVFQAVTHLGKLAADIFYFVFAAGIDQGEILSGDYQEEITALIKTTHGKRLLVNEIFS